LRSRRNTLKVLLDTSFILPTLGIDLGGEIDRGIRRLRELEAEIYYSRFSILEALWIASRIARRGSFDYDRFRVGLRSIMESGRYNLVDEGCEVFENAFKLYMLGHRDLIDNILYSISIALDIKLLTVDRELIKFITDNKLENTVVTPGQL